MQARQETNEGDPPSLVADAKPARSELGWTPCLHKLETIIEHAMLVDDFQAEAQRILQEVKS